MTVRTRNASRPTALVTAVALLSSIAGWPASAQSPGIFGAADNLAQLRAEDAWLILRERRVYDPKGRWIGRFTTIRAAPDGSLVGTLQTRPRYGYRRYAVPLYHISQKDGRVVLTAPLPSL